MPTLRYNDRAARGAPPLNGKRTKYSIAGRPGLVLDVTPGALEVSRRWFVRYQVGRGAHRRQGYDSIGDIKHWSLSQAWEEATRVIREAQSGKDPRATRQAAQKAEEAEARTFEMIYLEWLDNPGRKRSLRDRSREAYETQYKHMSGRLGSAAIASLRPADVRIAIEEIRVKTTDHHRGHRGYMATKCLKLVRSICKFAEERGYIDRDPTRGIDHPVPERNPDGRQHRPPTDIELRELWNAAPMHISPQHVRAMKLAFLLGKRVSEMCGALKSEIMLDDDKPSWFIPGGRVGNKSREDQVVPLPPLASLILDEQMSAAGESRLVFPARGKPQTPMLRHAPSQAFASLRSKLGIDNAVRFHDARGLISDQMAKLGVPSEYRSHVLHHTGDMRATLANSVYSTYDYEPQKRRALVLWEQRLLEIVEGRPAAGLSW